MKKIILKIVAVVLVIAGWFFSDSNRNAMRSKPKDGAERVL